MFEILYVSFLGQFGLNFEWKEPHVWPKPNFKPVGNVLPVKKTIFYGE
jgi:hypothetical protein